MATRLALAGLETTPTVNGLSFAGFYGSLAAQVGRDTSNAIEKQGVQKQLLAQARAQRSESSGVSLDEEAIRLVEYQRAYQGGRQAGVGTGPIVGSHHQHDSLRGLV
jgi:flagellar hook-associated protein 1 FlgK